LCAKATAAGLATSKTEKTNILSAFLNEVSAQRGKKLTAAQADLLGAYVQNVISAL
jgi:hypothetical protein